VVRAAGRPPANANQETIMNLIRRNPSSASGYRPRSVEDQFGSLVESMFEDMLAPLSSGGRWQGDGVATPRLNVTESEKSFEIQAELPGVRKEDVKVAIENQRVTIEGECRHDDEKREGEHVVYAERSVRKYVRAFSLPSDVDESAAQARLENGVLNLTLPKKQGAAATRLKIQ
jgi:HSP20 family protein